MTEGYENIPELKSVFLQESYVLDIEVRPGRITFTLDVVLTGDHPQYQPPASGEQFCYRRARLSFLGVTRCLWKNQGAPPARDATGELDYGNIDSFERHATGYSLAGDWGNMEVVASRLELELI